MVNLKEIYEEVDNLSKKKVMELMSTLINIDTSVPPGKNYREYVNSVIPYFKDLEYELTEVTLPEDLIEQIPFPLEGPRVNLVAKKNYNQEKEVTFYSHIDVVPVPEEDIENWRFPPFEATMVKSGKIFGRGIADMKGTLVCLIIALQIIQKLNLIPKFNVNVLTCTDEELGVYPGVRYLAERGYVKGTIFCMEGVINPFLPVGLAGCLDIEIEITGKSAPAGRNFMGINALEEAIPILVELKKLKKKVEKRESKVIPGFPEFGTGKKRNLTPAFNLDVIRAGIKANIVPDLCTLKIDRRIIPEENYVDVKLEILNAVERGKEKSKAVDVKVFFIYTYPPTKVNPNAFGVKRFKKTLSLVQNIPEEKIIHVGDAGASDMGFVSQILNTQDIIIHNVANVGSNFHGVNENIKLKDIKTFIKEIIVFLCADL